MNFIDKLSTMKWFIGKEDNVAFTFFILGYYYRNLVSHDDHGSPSTSISFFARLYMRIGTKIVENNPESS